MTFDIYLMIQCAIILVASPEEMTNFVAAYNKQGVYYPESTVIRFVKVDKFVHREIQGLRFNRFFFVKPHATSRFYPLKLCFIFHLR